MRNDSKRNTVYFTKTPYLKHTFQTWKYTIEQQKYLIMFNSQNSQITQQEVDQLAELLLKLPMVYATYKFVVGKIHSPLHLPLKPGAVFEKDRATKVTMHLQAEITRLLNILQQYDIISTINKEQQPKGNTFISPVIILAKSESLKIVLVANS